MLAQSSFPRSLFGPSRRLPLLALGACLASVSSAGTGLLSDGKGIVSWGDDNYGQVSGMPTSGSYTAIAGGGYHSLALRADGSIASWGNDDFGQVSNTPASGVYSAVAAGAYHSLALIARTDYDGDLLVTGTGNRAILNRSVSVAGGATVETTLRLVNSPVMTVAGDLRFGTGASASGAGIIQAKALAGGGSATLGNGVRLIAGLESASRFTGSLAVNGGAALGITGTGVLTPSGLSTGAGGEVRIDPGQRVVVNGAFANGGATTLRGNPNVLGGGAELEVLGTLTNAASTGMIVGRDAILRAGGLVNAGSLALTGGTNDVFGDVANTGSITLTGGATTTFYDDVVNDGTMTVRRLGASGATAIFLGSFSGSGSVAGGGDVLIEGDLRPGNSPASILMDANLALGAGASTLVEIAGTSAGLYDQVRVTGDLSLGGDLDVAFLDGYGLRYGDRFDVFTVGGDLRGTFDGLDDGATVGTSNGMDLRIHYGSTAVTLQAVPEPASIAALGLGALALLKRRRK